MDRIPNPQMFGFAREVVPLRMNNLRRIGWRNRPRQHRVYSQRDRDRAVMLRQRGFTYLSVARSIGPFCSTGTILQWVRRAQQQQARQRTQHQARQPQRGGRMITICVNSKLTK